MAKRSRNAEFEPQVFAIDVASELCLQLRRSSPRGIESARGIRIRVVVLLRFGNCRTDGCRGGWSTMHLLTRSNFSLKKWSGRLTGSLVLPQRTEILSTATSSFLDRRVLWWRHHFLIQLTENLKEFFLIFVVFYFFFFMTLGRCFESNNYYYFFKQILNIPLSFAIIRITYTAIILKLNIRKISV